MRHPGGEKGHCSNTIWPPASGRARLSTFCLVTSFNRYSQTEGELSLLFPYGHTANLLGGGPKPNSGLRCPVAECGRELAPSVSLLTALSLWPHTKDHVKWVIIGQGAEYIFLKGTGVSHRQRLIRHTGCVFSQDGDTARTKHKADPWLCCGGWA